MHIHKIKKSVKAQTEKLPDNSGTIIMYSGAPEATVDVTYRETSEPTLTAGANHTCGSYTGIVENWPADLQAGLKENVAGPVWEMVCSLFIPGGTC